jgi:hypothetical protein
MIQAPGAYFIKLFYGYSQYHKLKFAGKAVSFQNSVHPNHRDQCIDKEKQTCTARALYALAGNTKRGGITVPLTSC